MSNNHDKTTKEELIKERDLLIEELKEIGVQDPETGKWNPVPEEMVGDENDPNTVADRNEDYESRASVLEVLQERLETVEEKLKAFE